MGHAFIKDPGSCFYFSLCRISWGAVRLSPPAGCGCLKLLEASAACRLGGGVTEKMEEEVQNSAVSVENAGADICRRTAEEH